MCSYCLNTFFITRMKCRRQAKFIKKTCLFIPVWEIGSPNSMIPVLVSPPPLPHSLLGWLTSCQVLVGSRGERSHLETGLQRAFKCRLIHNNLLQEATLILSKHSPPGSLPHAKGLSFALFRPVQTQNRAISSPPPKSWGYRQYHCPQHSTSTLETHSNHTQAFASVQASRPGLVSAWLQSQKSWPFPFQFHPFSCVLSLLTLRS